MVEEDVVVVDELVVVDVELLVVGVLEVLVVEGMVEVALVGVGSVLLPRHPSRTRPAIANASNERFIRNLDSARWAGR